MRSTAALLTAAVLALVLLPACQEAEHPGEPAAEGPQIKVLRRGNGGDPGSLDPALAEDIHAFNVLADLYEGLVSTDAKGTLVPGVAESWQVSEDGRTYTFELRADARWSNADRVVAEDFVRAFRRVASPDTRSSYGFLLEPIENFAEVNAGERPIGDLGVAATGERQLTIRLGAAAGHVLSMLSMPIAYPVHASSARPGGFDDPASVVVNGPYRLGSRQPMGPIRLERNPHFREAATVNIDEVVYYPVVDEVAELNMYRAGELDITHTVPRAHVDMLKTDRPAELRIAPMLAFYYVALDVTEPPFDDRALRWALSLAIDREELVRVTGRGELPAYGIVPPGIPGHASTSYDLQGLDRGEREQLAREWLAKSGYASAPPAMTYIYDAGSVHGQIAIAVTAMWREVLGIDVQLDKREWMYFLDTRHDRNEWQLMRFSWFGDYNDAMTFFEIFRSDSPQNLPGYENDEYDRLVSKAAAATETDLREEQFAAAEQVLLNDYPIVPLYFYVSKHMVDPAVTGFEDNLLDRHPSRYLDVDRATAGASTAR